MQKKSFARASCIFLTVICSIASYSAALSVLQLIPVLSSLKATPKTQSLAFLFSLKHYISLLCRVYIFIYSLYTDSSFLTPNCLVYAYNYFDAVDQISPPCLYIHPLSLSYMFLSTTTQIQRQKLFAQQFSTKRSFQLYHGLATPSFLLVCQYTAPRVCHD
jgi:hypothetical protein